MAALTKAQKAELRHVRNEAFKRNRIKGTQPRHPDKPAPEYKKRANCVRLESDKAKRPDKSNVVYGYVEPPTEKPDNSLESFKNAFSDKLAALGWTRDDWALWKQARNDNPSLTLHDYRESLKVSK